MTTRIINFADGFSSATVPDTTAYLLSSDVGDSLCPLDSSSLVPVVNLPVIPTTKLPPEVKNIVEAASLSGFPTLGTPGVFYLALDTLKFYRWSGFDYTLMGKALNPYDFQDKATLANNATTNIPSLGFDLSQVMCSIIEYYLYRRVSGTFKWMSGKIKMVAVPDAAINADKWKFIEVERSEENGDSGVTFSLLEVATGKSSLSAALDNLAGTGHSCIIYFKVSTLLA